MAFKMRPSPMARNYGAPFNKKIGEDHTGEDHTNASHEATADPSKFNQRDLDASSKKSPSVGEVAVGAVANKAKQVVAGLKTGHTGRSNRKTGGFSEGYNLEELKQSKDTGELLKGLESKKKFKSYPQKGD